MKTGHVNFFFLMNFQERQCNLEVHSSKNVFFFLNCNFIIKIIKW